MELRHLRYFVALAEQGTFARTAERLRVAQPSLSRQIRGLERALGVTLVDRGAQASVLTPAGVAVVAAARAILTETARAVEHARRANDGLAGRCSICAGTLPTWTGLVARLVAVVRRDCPSIELDVTEGVGAAQWRAVRSGDVDLGIGMVPSPEFASLGPRHLLDQCFDAALLADSHPLARRSSITFTDLSAEPLIAIFGDDSDHRAMCRELASRTTPHSAMRDAATLADAFGQVAAGNGWTPFGESFTAWLPPGTASVPVTDLNCSIPLFVIGKRGALPPVTERVRAILLDLVRERSDPRALPFALPAANETRAEDAHGASESAAPAGSIPLALDFRHLRYCCAVVETGSLGRAAQRLSVTQPALSRQMRDLERMVGVALFTRTAKGVSTTPAGAALAEGGNRVLELTEAVSAEARRATRGSTRRCVIATIPAPVVARVATAVMRNAGAEVPEMQVSLAEVPTPAQPEALIAGQIDIGLCHAFTTVSPFLHQIHRERLLHDAACCALLAPDHALAVRSEIELADLARVPFLFMPRWLYPAFYDRVMALFAAHDFVPRIERPYDGLQTTWSLARRGEGWCIGFRTNLRYAPAGLAAVPVRELDLPLGIDMLHRRDETREVVVSVLGLVRRAASAEMAALAAGSPTRSRSRSFATPLAGDTNPREPPTGRYRT